MTHQLLADIKFDSNLMLLVCFLICLVGAVILNFTVEKPFMKLRNKLIK
jgi:peptidoglycan/LPS O-acetylase OafA/YrhL